MTADEIKALTDKQARDAVAKALGLRRGLSWYCPLVGVEGWRDSWVDKHDTMVHWFNDWSPCANIADAWPLWERLVFVDKFWTIFPSVDAEIVLEHTKGFDGEIDAQFRAPAPRAIVNAYLWTSENGLLRKDGEK